MGLMDRSKPVSGLRGSATHHPFATCNLNLATNPHHSDTTPREGLLQHSLKIESPFL